MIRPKVNLEQAIAVGGLNIKLVNYEIRSIHSLHGDKQELINMAREMRASFSLVEEISRLG